MPKIQKIGNSHWVSIPVHICKLKGWTKGNDLYFDIDQRTGKVVLDKMEETARSDSGYHHTQKEAERLKGIEATGQK